MILTPREARELRALAASMGVAPGQYLYGVVLDEFDIPYVVRYRILRGVGTGRP